MTQEIYELDEFEDDGQEQEGFCITDDGGAEWAMRKIAEAENEMSAWKDYYAEQYAKIETRCRQTIEFMKNKLADYFEQVPRRATKTGIEKYKLPSGELIRKPAGIEYQRDEAVMLEWCKAQHPEFIRVSEKASWSDVKAYIKETGELPDGVLPVEKPAAFEVKVNG